MTAGNVLGIFDFPRKNRNIFIDFWKFTGGMGQFVASPTDLIKTQIQMEGKRRLQGKPPRVNGVYDAFK